MCPCLPGTAQRPGKRDLFCPMLPPTPSFPHSQPTNGGDGERRRERWGGRHGGGMRNGLRAVSREGRRCQSHESGDAPPGTFLSQLFHNTPSFAHSSLSLHFFFSLSLRPSVQILPNQHLSPHLALTRFSNQSKMKWQVQCLRAYVLVKMCVHSH